MANTNGFTFNGAHSSGFFIVNAKQRQVAPPITPKLLAVPGRAGAWDFGTEIGTREITVQVTLIGASPQDYRKLVRDVAGWLLPTDGQPKQLVFDDEPDKYYMARLSGDSALAELTMFGTATLTFLCADPIAYSVVAADEVTWGSEVLTFNSTAYTMGNESPTPQTFTSAGTYAVTNNGNETVRPTVTITGAAATSITVSANGKSFTLPAFTNDTWTMDGANYNATNDAGNALYLMTGDFIELVPGDNTISISGTGLNVTFSVSFRDQFI